jgi:hypothetical protein
MLPGAITRNIADPRMAAGRFTSLRRYHRQAVSN